MHPLCALEYFVVTICVSVTCAHPAYLVLTLVSGAIYTSLLHGRLMRSLFSMCAAMLIFAAVLNPLFTHRGVTILFYLPSGNAFTLEALLYGIFAGLMLVCALVEFSCLNAIFTSDKILCLLGKIAPRLALLLSVSLRLIPEIGRYIKQAASINRLNSKKITDRARFGLSLISSALSYALEGSVITADSARSRDLGGERVSFSLYTIGRPELFYIFSSLILAVGAVIPIFTGALTMEFYPVIEISAISIAGVCGALCYAVFCFLPIALLLNRKIKFGRLRLGTA